MAWLQTANGSSELGAFYTPYEVSRMMAFLTHGDQIEELTSRPFVKLGEPASGAGGMVIAFAEVMLEKGYNPQEQLWVQCVDVDPVAAMMCYLQLSLLSIPGEVVTGNTLTLECSRVMRTPAHYLGFWDHKLKKTALSEDDVSDKQISLSSKPLVINQQSQLALFDLA